MEVLSWKLRTAIGFHDTGYPTYIVCVSISSLFYNLLIITRSNQLMEEGFQLTVNYNGKELLFPATLKVYGYIYKIEVDVNGCLITFERDEERNWRAMVDPEIQQKAKVVTTLLQAIADTLDKIVNE